MAPSHQQTRHARKLYVGGIGDATAEELNEFFMVRFTADWVWLGLVG